MTTETTTANNLQAIEIHGEWVVVDPDGGTWVPDEPIEDADAAIAACLASPMSGTWKQ